MKVLLTGATGFLGRAIVAELADKAVEIICVGGVHGVAADFNLDVGSAQDVGRLESVGSVDAVVHAAGIAHRFGNVSEKEFQRINIEGAANIARLAIKLKARQFIHISSVLVYGSQFSVGVIDESCRCLPEDSYAQSKFEGESAVISICEEARIPVTILRPAPMIGEGSRGNLFRLIRAIDSRRFLWIGRGDNLKSALYVGDAARAVQSILENNKHENSTEIFNLSAPAIPMNVIVETIAEALNRKIPGIRMPVAAPLWTLRSASRILQLHKLRNVLRTLEKWLSTESYSSEAIHAAYGFSPEISIPEALKREVAGYRKSIHS